MIANSLVVNGAARFLNKIYANDLQVSGTTSFTNLSVTGNVSINGTINIGSSNNANTIINLNGKRAIAGVSGSDYGWLRINDTKAFSSGVYFGSSLIRTDGQLQVGGSGSKLAVTTTDDQSGISGATNGHALFGVPIEMNGTANYWDTTGKLVTSNLDVNSARITNLQVTDTLRSFKWDIDHVANLGGNFLVTPTYNATENSATFVVNNISGTTITATINDSTAISGSTLGGVTWAKDSKIKITGKIGGIVLPVCEGKLTNQLNSSSGTMNIQFTYPNQSSNSLSAKTYGASEVSGLTVMLLTIGATNPIGIYMTARDSNNYSHISLYGGTDTKPVVRIGNLQGLDPVGGIDPDDPTVTNKWGIYTYNGFFKGVIAAERGVIGSNITVTNNWQIGDRSIWYGNKTPGASTTALVISTGTSSTNSIAGSGTSSKTWMIAAGTGFGVTNTGVMYATGAHVSGEITAESGTIGGASISNGVLQIKEANISGTISGSKITATSIEASKLNITDLQAIGATIGGFTIDTTSIHTKNVAVTSYADNSIALSSADFTRAINTTSREGLRFAIGDKFGVTGDGKLYASGVDVTGKIVANEGIIGGANISNGVLQIKEANISGTISGSKITAGTLSIGSLDSSTQTKINNGDAANTKVDTLREEFDIYSNPIAEKEYKNVVISANNDPSGYLYFGSVKPNDYYTPWRVKYVLQVFIDSVSDSGQLSDVTIGGAKNTWYSYQTYNTINNTNYRPIYGHMLYTLTNTGVTNGYGHLLGVRLHSAYWPAVSSDYKRTVKIKIIEAENCTPSLLDSMVLYSAAPGTGSTNYYARYSFDGTTQGYTQSGDRNETNHLLNNFAGKTGNKGIWATGLFMEDAAGTFQSICTASDGTTTTSNRTTATTKKANTNGFKVNGTLYYSGTSYNANVNMTTNNVYGSIGAFDSRYSLNTMTGTTAANTTGLTVYKPFYLVGSINDSDGLFYFDSTWWTQTPNTTGKIYILAGSVYDITGSGSAYYYRINLYEQNTWFIYDGSALVPYIKYASDEAAKTATTYITDIDTKKGITIKPSDSSGNDYLQMNSSAISFYRNNIQTTKMEDSAIRVGKLGTNLRNVYITDSAVQIRNNTDVLAEYGSAIKLYKPGSTTAVVTIDSNGGTFIGSIAATSGTIGSNSTAGNRWQIGDKAIYNTTNSMTSTGVGTYIGVDGIRNYKDANTFVNIQNGKITAKAVDLSGTIAATTGTFGNGTNKITVGNGGTANSAIYYGMSTLNSTTATGFYIGTDGIALGGGNFKVTATGSAIFKDATLGDLNKYHINIDNDSLDIMNSSTIKASFGENILLGEETGRKIIIDNTGLSLSNRFQENLFEIKFSEEADLISGWENISVGWINANEQFEYLITVYPIGAITLNFPYKYQESAGAASDYRYMFTFTSGIEQTITALVDTANSSNNEITVRYDGYRTFYITTFQSLQLSNGGHTAQFRYNYSESKTSYFTFGRRRDNSIGLFSFAEGYSVTALAKYSHAEGYQTEAVSEYSHAEGWNTTAGDIGKLPRLITAAHAEGSGTLASGSFSHAEGSHTIASGTGSHAEGGSYYSYPTTASGYYSHAEGAGTVASKEYSHAEGRQAKANGIASHAGGVQTIAQGNYQTAIGTRNIADDTSAFIIGNGEPDLLVNGAQDRSNAFTVDWNGNIWAAGNITTPGNATFTGTGSFGGSLSANSGNFTNDIKTTAGSIIIDSKSKGYYLKDKSNNRYSAIHDNGNNLCIGHSAGANYHHAGGTYISSGWDTTNNKGNATIYITQPNSNSTSGGNTITIHSVYHSGNYTSIPTAVAGSHAGLMSAADKTAVNHLAITVLTATRVNNSYISASDFRVNPFRMGNIAVTDINCTLTNAFPKPSDGKFVQIGTITGVTLSSAARITVPTTNSGSNVTVMIEADGKVSIFNHSSTNATGIIRCQLINKCS